MTAPAPSDPSAKKRTFGKYQSLEHVATGGMGAVYKAWDPDLKMVVALKILSPEMAEKANLKNRFESEAKIGLKLQHPNIVKLYKYSKINGIYYLALEFVEGENLHEFINKHKQVDAKEARLIIMQAAKALDHVHRNGIIHRDIKPSNFLIRYERAYPVIKLIDLGLAKKLQEDEEEMRLTKTGTTLGTVDYMAPEQARDATKADIRSDIYSLGCTLYHMLAGKPPFAEGSVTERIYKHIHTVPNDIRDSSHLVPAGMADILKKMLAKDASHRYPTPAELIKDLEAGRRLDQPIQEDLLAQLAVEESQTPKSEKPGGSSRKNRKPAIKPPAPEPSVVEEEEESGPREPLPPWIFPVAGAALALLVLGIWGMILMNGETRTPTNPAVPLVPSTQAQTAPTTAP